MQKIVKIIASGKDKPRKLYNLQKDTLKEQKQSLFYVYKCCQGDVNIVFKTLLTKKPAMMIAD